MPRIPKNTSRSRVRVAAQLTEADLDALLAACPHDGWELLVLLAWHSGLRRGEAIAIRGEHIDFENHTIRLPANKARDDDAIAIIPPELDTWLREQYPDGVPDGSLVQKTPRDERNTSKYFARNISRKAKVRGSSTWGGCTLHDLRRSFGTRWAAKVPAQVLQRMMRHSSLATTMQFYADVEQAAIEAMWVVNRIYSSMTSEDKSRRGSGNREHE